MKEFVISTKEELDVILRTDKDVLDFTKKSETLGYEIAYPYYSNTENYESLTLSVDPKEDEYLPTIYFDQNFSTEEISVKILTTSYGSLKTNDFPKFLESQTNGYEMAKLVEEYLPLLPHFIIEKN